ncbi:hypothetical protein HMPREF1583_01177 [Gardnerella vaginalis JCP8151B]|nr:hypothetical protein HMPREF1583_01177 [Gardnerella vaginalis JCP8151B]
MLICLCDLTLVSRVWICMDERRKTCKSKKIGVHYGSSLRSMWQGTADRFQRFTFAHSQ